MEVELRVVVHHPQDVGVAGEDEEVVARWAAEAGVGEKLDPGDGAVL